MDTTPEITPFIPKTRPVRSFRAIARAIDAGLEIEAKDAERADRRGFVARWLVMASLPYRDDPMRKVWSRVNGDTTLMIHSGFESTGEIEVDENGNERPKVKYLGVPYGSVPRVVLAWLATEAVKKKSPEIELGDTVREFFDKLGIRHASGGHYGTITVVKDQLRRLMSATIKVEQRGHHKRDEQLNIGRTVEDGSASWWTPMQSKQRALWQPRITLSTDFFNGLREHAVPVDLRAINALSSSPLAIDLYCFITWRVYDLHSEICISWDRLQRQMGSDSRRHKFIENVRLALPRVKRVYKAIENTVSADAAGLTLKPSATAIPRVA